MPLRLVTDSYESVNSARVYVGLQPHARLVVSGVIGPFSGENGREAVGETTDVRASLPVELHFRLAANGDGPIAERDSRADPARAQVEGHTVIVA
jgi:hypothetical protein